MKSSKQRWQALTGWDRVSGQWLRRKHFTAQALARIAAHISSSELRHTGELMVAVEGASPTHEHDSHRRALEVFGRLRTWDTPLNTGVLLYLALDKRSIQIIADRGVAAHDSVWADVCSQLQTHFQQGEFIDGVLAAIDAIESVLLVSCPPLPDGQAGHNDLPDAPVLL
ncbi:TPM domain-containing protein [Alcaligenaceae bacterium]|nr:TPM domain-containing protein [Alcaligenaceae bacterium]